MSRALHRHDPDVFTAAINEMCDVGADFSTFERMRQGKPVHFPRQPEGLPHSTERFVWPVKDYAWLPRSTTTASPRPSACGAGSSSTPSARCPGSRG